VSAVVVIPARWASARLPGKPLVPLLGRPMIEWVHAAALRCDAVRRVVVATDDARIAEACEAFGAEVALTGADHPSGTDRVAEAARTLDGDVIVNVQGDEPLLEPRLLDALLAALASDAGARMATLVAPGDPDRYEDPNCVKALIDARDRAMTFTRASVPAVPKGESPPAYWQHLGLYAYERSFLLDLVDRPPSRLERIERLEQLRVLEAGDAIAVGRVTGWPGTAVDVAQDVARAEEALRAQGRIEPRFAVTPRRGPAAR